MSSFQRSCGLLGCFVYLFINGSQTALSFCHPGKVGSTQELRKYVTSCLVEKKNINEMRHKCVDPQSIILNLPISTITVKQQLRSLKHFILLLSQDHSIQPSLVEICRRQSHFRVTSFQNYSSKCKFVTHEQQQILSEHLTHSLQRREQCVGTVPRSRETSVVHLTVLGFKPKAF